MDKQDEGTRDNLNTAPALALALRGRAALGLIALWLCASTAFAEPRYTVINLNFRHGCSDVNNAGQATGGSYDGHAYIYSNGQMQDLGERIGGIKYNAIIDGCAINDAGQVTGSAYFVLGPDNVEFHAFFYSSKMQDLGIHSQGYDINNAGQVTGYSNGYAFIWDSRNGMLGLGALGGTGSVGRGINSAGQVTGWSYTDPADDYNHAFLHSNGQMQNLGTLGGANSEGRAINNAGQVTGVADTADGNSRAFLYGNSNGQMQDLGTLGGA